MATKPDSKELEALLGNQSARTNRVWVAHQQVEPLPQLTRQIMGGLSMFSDAELDDVLAQYTFITVLMQRISATVATVAARALPQIIEERGGSIPPPPSPEELELVKKKVDELQCELDKQIAKEVGVSEETLAEAMPHLE